MPANITVLNSIWTFFLALAVVETIVYHMGLLNLRDGNLNFGSFLKLPHGTDSHFLNWFDVSVIFVLLWTVALRAANIPYMPKDCIPELPIFDVIVLTIGSIAFTHFISRFLLGFKANQPVELIVPTVVGLAIPFLQQWITMNYAPEKLFHIGMWAFLFAIFIFFSTRHDLFPFLRMNDIGWLKDFVLMTIIFILGTLLYPKVEDILASPKVIPWIIVATLSVVAIIVAFADLNFPNTLTGQDYCRAMLSANKIAPNEMNMGSLRNILNTHILFRTALFLFGGVVCPFVLYVVYRLTK
jgi:hypothetical protein